jgi:hypothetical protein
MLMVETMCRHVLNGPSGLKTKVLLGGSPHDRNGKILPRLDQEDKEVSGREEQERALESYWKRAV